MELVDDDTCYLTFTLEDDDTFTLDVSTNDPDTCVPTSVGTHDHIVRTYLENFPNDEVVDVEFTVTIQDCPTSFVRDETTYDLLFALDDDLDASGDGTFIEDSKIWYVIDGPDNNGDGMVGWEFDFPVEPVDPNQCYRELGYYWTVNTADSADYP